MPNHNLRHHVDDEYLLAVYDSITGTPLGEILDGMSRTAVVEKFSERLSREQALVLVECYETDTDPDATADRLSSTG